MANTLSQNCRRTEYFMSPWELKKLRVFTLLALTGFPLFSVLGMYDVFDDWTRPTRLIVTTILLMSYIPLVSNRIFNRLGNRHKYLDEREREAMIHAKAFAYKFGLIGLITFIAVGLSLLAVLGVDFKTPAVTIAGLFMTAMNIAFILLFLPITYIAWTQKPLDPEELEAE